MRVNSNVAGIPDSAEVLMATLGPPRLPHKVGVIALALLAGWGLCCYAYQVKNGLAVTAMNNYFSWGVYIINFVFFIGISMAGTLISAMLRLTGAEWRRPITRMAEGVTLFALLVAGPMVIIDMGRPDRFFFVFLHGRVQSPILWDVMSLTTYMTGSLLYLYLPLIPDLAILRDQGNRFSPWRQRLYRALALGWKGTEGQHRSLERAISVMSVVIIPVAISIHTVTAWIFGMTLRPGWHSSIIGPDFVVGALYSGIAAVIVAMAMFRRFFHLEEFLTPRHFRNLGLLLLVAGVAYLYFTVNNFVGETYVTESEEQELLGSIFGGSYAVQFWTMVSLGMIVPCLMLALPWTRSIGGIVTASVLVNIGMWIMRYVIVVPTLSSPFLPLAKQPLAYVPTLVEWSITVGGFAAFGLFYILFSKVFPIISIWELHPERAGHGGGAA
jgi:molybdopterin-containing oxidoreductase family membrane subunit